MFLLAVFGCVSLLWAADPFVGTWKLNVAKSKVSDPSMMPKSEILKAEDLDNGLKCVYDGIKADGSAYQVAFSAQFDGKDYPLTAVPSVDAIAARKIDANTILLVFKKAGKEVIWPHISISKDGKTLTDRATGTLSTGQEITATWVYDKQ